MNLLKVLQRRRRLSAAKGKKILGKKIKEKRKRPVSKRAEKKACFETSFMLFMVTHRLRWRYYDRVVKYFASKLWPRSFALDSVQLAKLAFSRMCHNKYFDISYTLVVKIDYRV